jgi:hypothetical protein
MSLLPGQIIPQGYPIGKTNPDGTVTIDKNWWLFLYNLAQNTLTTNSGSAAVSAMEQLLLNEIDARVTDTVPSSGGGGSGTVTSVSIVSANGFAGTVASPTTTPAITMETSITGVLKGNGTAIEAAVAGTDYSTFFNPMTTKGDIIYEDATPAPNRLAIGTEEQVVTVSSGLPVYKAPTDASAGTFGSAYDSTIVTVDAYGRITSITDTPIINAINPINLFIGVTTGGWWDFTDITTLFQDTAGTTPVTATGQKIALCKDKSGLGFDAVQATSGAQATWEQDADGINFAQFNGAQFYTCGLATNVDNFVMAWCMAVNSTSMSSIGVIIDNRGSGTLGTVKGNKIFVTGYNGDAGVACDSGAGPYMQVESTNPLLVLNQKNLFAAYLKDHAVLGVTFNGLNYAPASSTTMGTVVNTKTTHIGCDQGGTTQFLYGNLYQIILAGRPGINIDCHQLHDYLSTACIA